MSGVHTHALDRSDPVRYQASRRVTWASVLLNLVLTVAQIVVGVIGGSQALVADGVHTLSDLLTDALVLFALKQSAKGADEEHPYGHGRIETAVTLILGAMLVLVALGIAWRAGERLLFAADAFAAPSVLTFWVAVVTLAVKEGLFRYTMRTAARFDSAMLRANAWHHRSDAVSSLIVLIGIGGALYGFPYLDAVAAIIVSLLIAHIGVRLGWGAMQELIDTGLDADELARIRAAIATVNGVEALHLLRTRRVGADAFVDVHIRVDRRVSVSEGHQIGETVRQKLIDTIPAVTDVIVHVDTEDDGAGDGDARLPLREEIKQRLERCFTAIPEARLIEDVQLHYGQGRVDVELRLPLSAIATTEQGQALAERLAQAAEQDPVVGKVTVFFRSLHQTG